MTKLRWFLLALTVTVLPTAQAASTAAGPAVAMVSFLAGSAWIQRSGQSNMVALFDPLRVGDVLVSRHDSNVVIGFANGTRYRLRGDFQAEVAADGLQPGRGEIEALETVSAMPDLLPLAADTARSASAGAVPLRHNTSELLKLYPAAGDALPATGAVLRFTAIPGIEHYRVEVQNRNGYTILALQTLQPQVDVSPGVLEAGAGYHWQVRTLDPDLPSIANSASFRTLDKSEIRERQALLRQTVGNQASADLILLLAALDRHLGMRREACLGLQRAASLQPAAQSIARARLRFSCPRLGL